MSGDWIKFEANTPDKPEVLAITAAMGWDDPDLTVGKLLRVWRWFDQHTVDGNAAGVTSALVDRIVGVNGLCDAMASVGWLVVDGSGITLPNFSRHNGKTAKQRALTAKRVSDHKKNGGKGNADTVSKVTLTPLPTALPREEKRREEQKQEHKAPVSPADFRADLFRRWKALENGGGGAFLNALFRDHKPEQRVLEAVERTLDETRNDPKAFVVGVLRNEAKVDGEVDLIMRMAI